MSMGGMKHILKNSGTDNNEGFAVLLTALMAVGTSRLPQGNQRQNLCNELIFQHNYSMYCIYSYPPPRGVTIQLLQN
jgi:hypothetical protein